MEKIPTKDETREAFLNPRVGDIFSEMCNFWVYVLDVDADSVVVLELSSVTAEAFRYTRDYYPRRYAYSTCKNKPLDEVTHWVTFHKNDLERCLEWKTADLEIKDYRSVEIVELEKELAKLREEEKKLLDRLPKLDREISSLTTRIVALKH